MHFMYNMPVMVYFGENSADQYLTGELEKYGENIMLAYGKGSIKKNGIYDQVMNILTACKKTVYELSDIPANSTYEKVQEGIRLYKEKRLI